MSPTQPAAPPLRSTWPAFALFMSSANAFGVWVALANGSPWTEAPHAGGLPEVIPGLSQGVFGSSRLVYVLTLINVYAFGMALAAALAVRRLQPGRWSVMGPLLASACTPWLWYPVARCQPDIGGLALALYALALYLPARRRGLDNGRLVALGLTLALLTWFRDWGVYWVFWFGAGLSGELLWDSLRGGECRRRPLLALLPSAIPVVDAVSADALSTGGWNIAEWRETAGSFGGLWCAAVVGCWVYLSRFRDTRRTAHFLAATALAGFLHFTWSHTVEARDAYLLGPAAILLPGLVLAKRLNRPFPLSRKLAVFFAVLAFGMLGRFAAFIWNPPEAQRFGEPWIPTAREGPEGG